MIHHQQSNIAYVKGEEKQGRETCKTSTSSGKDLPWQKLFRNSAKWWDNRNGKPTSQHTDLKHPIAGEPLWLDSRDTSSWTIEGLRTPNRRHGKSQKHRSSHRKFRAFLKACTRRKDLLEGTRLHNEIVQRGLIEKCSHDLVLMYAKCGELAKAEELLQTHKSNSNLVTWTALIAAYAREGHGQNALDCFEQMQSEGLLPDAVTYASILKACALLGAADKGKQLHDEIARQGLLSNDVVLGSALVDMYAKCGAASMAQQVLEGLASRDVVTWNALIAGYVQGGHMEQALNCFEEMQGEGILPDAVTFLSILKACATIRAADKGKRIHDEIERQGLLQNDVALGSALVDMYAKCGVVSKARQVLDELPSRNVVTWGAMIVGCAQGGHAEQALNCYEEMRREGILPDAVTFLWILKACAMIGAADKGKLIHDEITRRGMLRNDVMLGSALVDMYAKCGAVVKARQVLDELPSRNVVTWNALITGCAQGGHADKALFCFEEMQREGVLPDAVTFSCVLNVCNHQGLVEEAQAVFLKMSTEYAVTPSLECYTCMVDLFGRVGHLEKAVRLIKGMPSYDCSIVWHTLLGACRKWSDVNVGRWAFEQAVNLDKSDGPAYVLMANIYARAGMGQEAVDIEAMRIKNRAWKKPGSTVQIDSTNAWI